MSDIRVSLLDAVMEYYPYVNIQLVLKIVLCLFSLITLVCAGLLVHYSEGWSSKELLNFSKNEFYDRTFDIFLMALLQVSLLPLIAWGAIYFGVEKREEEKILKCSCFRCYYGESQKYSTSEKPDSFDSLRDSEGNQPLLKSGESEEAQTQVLHEGYDEEESQQNIQNSKKKADESHFQIKKVLDEQKGIWLAVLFVFSTCIQVYVGLKCVSFNYTNVNIQGSLMGLGVLWINVITFLLREIVNRTTREDGEWMPAIHPHRLHLHVTLASNWCDLCGQPCEGRAYRCKLCDFDVCIKCFSKKDKVMLEGQLRGDKVLAAR